MSGLVLLSIMFCGLRGAFAVTHFWKAFYTASTGLSEFPQFVAVNIVDDEPVGYLDSRTSSVQYRQKWMEEHLGPEYLKQEINVLKGNMAWFKTNVGILMESFNQSGGVHTVQWMFGCEWDDETGATGGFDQEGYDGEDFLTYDLENQHCVALAQSGFSTAQKMNNNPAQLEHWKHYLTQECVAWLQKYVSCRRSALERTVAPKVSLLQKDPSSPVTCHVTGFYPRGFMVTWQRNGEDLDEDVELGETVPNGDGTFQTRSRLTVKPEEWKSREYTCTVQHKSLEQDIVLPVKEENIRRNSDIKNGSSPPMGVIIGCVLGALILILAVIGVVIWKKRSSGYGKTSTSDTGSEGSDRPAVKA